MLGAALVTKGSEQAIAAPSTNDGIWHKARAQCRACEVRKRSLERELKAGPGTRVVEIHPNFPDLYRRKVAELGTLLADDDERPRAIEAIRGRGVDGRSTSAFRVSRDAQNVRIYERDRHASPTSDDSVNVRVPARIVPMDKKAFP